MRFSAFASFSISANLFTNFAFCTHQLRFGSEGAESAELTIENKTSPYSRQCSRMIRILPLGQLVDLPHGAFPKTSSVLSQSKSLLFAFSVFFPHSLKADDLWEYQKHLGVGFFAPFPFLILFPHEERASSALPARVSPKTWVCRVISLSQISFKTASKLNAPRSSARTEWNITCKKSHKLVCKHLIVFAVERVYCLCTPLTIMLFLSFQRLNPIPWTAFSPRKIRTLPKRSSIVYLSFKFMSIPP